MKRTYSWIYFVQNWPNDMPCYSHFSRLHFQGGRDIPEIHESIAHFNLHGNQNKQKPHASKRWGTNLSPQKSKYSKCFYWPKYQVVEEETSLIKVKPNILIQITCHSHRNDQQENDQKPQHAAYPVKLLSVRRNQVYNVASGCTCQCCTA